ncbi:Glu/Leu/Phe/Val dehydrogenase dimerization domain-containing protein [Amycolatopsis alba]|uniref:Glu/Leu/Phe/Val dehydrogenase n=1 Tax=Amycolatopsis alba DSM 44262 TaxID=1125972 RepID=A0A229REV9_AMYAL|nr:Glu/Leu/Phe/Val dehydrogenase dimerization domain-containing protein [Amycolatopsis alba]OXM45190.1 Glu/Leu/Phe/Val dehydrogenase [Amycolatopsis alba DSM 44262]
MFRYTWSSGEVDVHLVADSVIGGLCAGGIRIAPDVGEADVAKLARLMTLKLASGGIPLGGAKSAVVLKPGADRKAALDQAALALEPFLRSKYLLGEDSGSTASDVVAIYRGLGIDLISFVVAKAAERGKVLDVPDGITVEHLLNEEFAGTLSGSGAVHALEAAAAVTGATLHGKRAAVQGFGSVGHAAAVALANAGLSVVTVSDVHGVVHNPDGFSPEFLASARVGSGEIDRDRLPAGTRLLPGHDWLSLPASVLVPAATAGSITTGNLASVHPDVRFVVEGANDPLTVEAEQALEDRGVTVLPDFIANAGSAVTFGLLVTGESTLDKVADEFRNRIDRAIQACVPAGGGAPRYVRDRALARARAYLATVSGQAR